MTRHPAPAARSFVRSHAIILLAALLAAAIAVLAAAPAGHAATELAGAHSPGTAAAAPPTAKKNKAKKKGEPRAKRRRPARAKAVASVPNPHEISDKAPKIVAFPSETAAVSKAFADHRRTQLADAEKVARAAQQSDRWRTVLFELRDLDSRADPESCFWRVAAYYRLGEVRRARLIRQGCDITPRDEATLEAEDVAAAALQPASGLPELGTSRGPDEDDRSQRTEASQPVPNATAYAGPGPARFK